jgi:hypothetical protein
MAKRNTPEPDPRKMPALDVIKYWARKGLTTRSIAAKCGHTQNDFLDALDYKVNGVAPLRMAYELARAEYECELREQKAALLLSVESEKLKYNIIKDTLIELNNRPGVQIQTNDAGFVGYTIDIVAKTADKEADGK